MKTEAEFREFFNTEMRKALAPLEAQRQKAVHAVVVACGGLVLLLGGIALVAVYAMRGEFPFETVGAVLAFGALGIWGLYYHLTKEYVHDFKEAIIRPLVQFYEKGLRYRQEAFIPESSFRESGLFQTDIDRYHGEDMVDGTIDKTAFQFSEIHAEYKKETRTKNGKTTQWQTIFSGVFFIADFNKEFKGFTRVVPDAAEKMLGSWLGGMLQKASTIFSNTELVKLEDPEFEKEFAVYGTDQVEARYILSTSLMARIMNYRKRTGNALHLSFRKSKVFVAISTQRNFFEPRIWSTIMNDQLYFGFFHDLDLVLSIIDELNLNLRIWSKA